MEKYSVEMDEEVKMATAGGCPQCGAKLDDGGACPKHGTEPFEKKQETEKKDK